MEEVRGGTAVQAGCQRYGSRAASDCVAPSTGELGLVRIRVCPCSCCPGGRPAAPLKSPERAKMESRQVRPTPLAPPALAFRAAEPPLRRGERQESLTSCQCTGPSLAAPAGTADR